MAWSRKTILVVVLVVLALGAAVWALGDPAPNPNGLGALPPSGPVDAGQGYSVPTPPPNEGLSSPTAAPNQPVEIAPGVTLDPGDDGRLPVSVRWVRHMYAPETMAVEGDTVYVADVAFFAFDVTDGTLHWRVIEPTGEGFDADGGVEIGTHGSGQVEVWAPWNYDLLVDKHSGEIDRLEGDPVPGSKVTPLPAPRPTTAFQVHVGLQKAVARYPGGAVAWRISVERPEFDEATPIAVPGGMLLLLSSGDLVALDVPGST